MKAEDLHCQKELNQRKELAHQFQEVLERILSGETLDPYARDVSALCVSDLFEVIAAHLMAKIPGREWHWYDGVVGLEASRKTARQVEFKGKIWVGTIKMQKNSGQKIFEQR